jgi:hypothetical protein
VTEARPGEVVSHRTASKPRRFPPEVARGWRVTERIPCPRFRALSSAFEGDLRRRVARDRASRAGLSRVPCVEHASPAAVAARPRGTRGGQSRGGREPACDPEPCGRRRYRPAASATPTAPVETTPGTRCSDVEEGLRRSSIGTTPRHRNATLARIEPGGSRSRRAPTAPRRIPWITIPPRSGSHLERR